jgi:hypothetical protein
MAPLTSSCRSTFSKPEDAEAFAEPFGGKRLPESVITLKTGEAIAGQRATGLQVSPLFGLPPSSGLSPSFASHFDGRWS